LAATNPSEPPAWIVNPVVVTEAEVLDPSLLPPIGVDVFAPVRTYSFPLMSWAWELVNVTVMPVRLVSR
jgi:hypothetical protein